MAQGGQLCSKPYEAMNKPSLVQITPIQIQHKAKLQSISEFIGYTYDCTDSRAHHEYQKLIARRFS